MLLGLNHLLVFLFRFVYFTKTRTIRTSSRRHSTVVNHNCPVVLQFLNAVNLG